MDFSFTEEQKQLHDEIIRFSQKELNKGTVVRDMGGEFSHDLWLKCGKMGLQGLPVPEEYGGVGLDPLSTAYALEAFGYGCHDGGLAFAICAHLLACVVPIWKFGNDEQRSRYLPGLCNGTIIAANAMTEPETGSDAFAMSTRAKADDKGFLINGKKIFISNSHIADLVLVFAVTDAEKGYHGGITAFLVDKETPGFKKGQKFEKMGLHTCPLGELVFEDVQVPAEAILGGVGGGANVFNHAMNWERIFIAASHIGTMERLLEESIKYARTRTQFGQQIGKFQAISHKIADMKVQLETARLLTYKVAWILERTRNVSMEASMVKLFVSESLFKAALDTVMILGGYGYMAEYEVERVLRDAVGGTIYSGTSDIQRNIIARWLGL